MTAPPSQLAPAALLLGALVAAPALAQTEPEPFYFAGVRGVGAESCASQRAIGERVSARLGRDPFAAGAARAIEAYATHSETGWRAQIFVRDREGKLAGSRELTSDAPDCASIEAAVVLALALAIDPDAGFRPAAPRPILPRTPAPSPPSQGWTTPVVPSPAPPAVETPRPAAAPAPPSNALRADAITLRGGAGWGLLPGAAPAVSLSAQFGVAPRASITTEALWMPEARTSDQRFSFGLSAFSLGGCFDVVHRDAVELAGCGSLWAGSLHAVVFALTPTEPGDRAWAAGALTPRLRIGLLPHLHLELGGHIVVPFVRRPFLVTGSADPVFQEAPVAFLPFLGAGANFP